MACHTQLRNGDVALLKKGIVDLFGPQNLSLFSNQEQHKKLLDLQNALSCHVIEAPLFLNEILPAFDPIHLPLALFSAVLFGRRSAVRGLTLTPTPTPTLTLTINLTAVRGAMHELSDCIHGHEHSLELERGL